MSFLKKTLSPSNLYNAGFYTGPIKSIVTLSPRNARNIQNSVTKILRVFKAKLESEGTKGLPEVL